MLNRMLLNVIGRVFGASSRVYAEAYARLLPDGGYDKWEAEQAYMTPEEIREKQVEEMYWQAMEEDEAYGDGKVPF